MIPFRQFLNSIAQTQKLKQADIPGPVSMPPWKALRKSVRDVNDPKLPKVLLDVMPVANALQQHPNASQLVDRKPPYGMEVKVDPKSLLLINRKPPYGTEIIEDPKSTEL